MPHIASLPWYDEPACRGEVDAFWNVLAAEFTGGGMADVPRRLNRTLPLPRQWMDPNLIISQCCGLDLFTQPATHLVAIARPVFADVDCDDGEYFSHIVVAEDRSNPPFARWVINAPSSRSGCTALLGWAARQGVSELRASDGPVSAGAPIQVSGSHANSLDWLREGRGDLAAIDAHSWPRLDTRGIRIIGRSATAPAPPFVMHRHSGIPPDLVREALCRAVAQAGHRIGVRAIRPATRDTYRPLHTEALGITLVQAPA